MSETLDNLNESGSKGRPTFLTVLCILSFISAGIAIVLLLLGGAITGVAQSVASDQGADGAVVSSAAGTAWAYIGAAAALTIISLIGVIQMWKLKKTGFYVYTGAAILGIVVPLIMGQAFGVFGTLITVAFIVMYGLNLKHMK
jgi:hypothetical protein